MSGVKNNTPEAHVMAAQQALYHRARCNLAARRGEYNATMERT
jgi:fructose-bisphosphate aldolase class I